MFPELCIGTTSTGRTFYDKVTIVNVQSKPWLFAQITDRGENILNMERVVKFLEK